MTTPSSALDPGQESAPDDGTSEQESRKPSVLVVDDDEAIRQLIAVNLQFEGFNVVGVAADGRKAVGRSAGTARSRNDGHHDAGDGRH